MRRHLPAEQRPVQRDLHREALVALCHPHRWRQPTWFWVNIAGIDTDGQRVGYRGPVLGWHSGNVTIRGGNRLRRHHPGVHITDTHTQRGGHTE